MKKVIYMIVTIALLAVAVFLIVSPQKAEAPEVVSENTEVVDESGVDEPAGLMDFNYTIDTERSEVEWVAGKKFLVDWIDKGTVSIDRGSTTLPENDNGMIGGIAIDMNTIEVTETGSGGGFNLLMNHLKSEDFFDVENHPEARFMITGGDRESIEGDLTIRGITAPAVAEVTEWNDEDMYIMGSMTVDRATYGVNYNLESLIGRIENQVINDTFDLNFKIYYTENQ